jgi:D-serine deaminase-like pyridoxal phosphate-dependent protein
LEAGAAGLTVATPFEAEVMASVCGDLLVAYPPVGASKLARLMALPPSVDLSVALDSPEALTPLAAAAVAAGRSVGVLLELDLGARRVGVPSPAQAVALARTVAELEGVEYRGVAFYPGHIRAPLDEQDNAIAQLSHDVGVFVAALSESGLAPAVVSGGSTPTLFRSHEIAGVTEIRPGTCIFYDRDIVAMDVASWDEIAYTVLATVVSTAVPGRAAIDAGSKALSKEVFRSGGSAFGVLFDHPEVELVSLSEEHGVLDLSSTEWTPRVGDRVRVVPNHVCVSTNLQDRLLVRQGDEVVAWPIDARGRGMRAP